MPRSYKDDEKQCDMCGAASSLVTAEIEGTQLNVCRNCASFGKIVPKPRIARKIEPRIGRPTQRSTVPDREIIQYVRGDYAQLVKHGREKKGLKQEELARMMAEKESLLVKVESGHFKPGIDLARRLEKFLTITLVEQHEEVRQPKKEAEKEGAFTLGDIVKVRKK